MKQLEVSILGQVYMLGCPEGGEKLLAAAVAAVDHEMSSIRNSGKVKARERIAVLAALNLAYQLAERGNAAPAPAPDPYPVTTTTSPRSNGQREDETHTDADVDALVRRIDAALGDDGKLL
jgi:cell division protein ZapA